MVEKKSKYDTDPLDPDFVRRTEEIDGATREVARTPNEQARRHESSEDPTRRLSDSPAYDEPYPSPSASYPSVFVPPVYQPPQNYTNFGANTPPTPTAHADRLAQHASDGRPTSRRIAGLGLPENVSMILPYTPFYIGLVASIVELLLVPRHEHRVRFHAAQGLALQLAIIAISFLFGVLSFFTDSGFGGWLFSLAAFIFLVVSMGRVWKGAEHRLAPLEEPTRKLNQQFEPRQQ